MSDIDTSGAAAEAPVIETTTETSAPAPAPAGAEASAPAESAPAPAEGAEPAKQPGETEGEYKQRLYGATQALAQSRARERALQRQLAEAQGKTPTRPTIEIPDANDDPLAALQALRELAITLQNEQVTEAERTATETAQTQYVNELKSAYEESEQLFASYQPDFPDAARHYAQSRIAELKVLGSEDNAAKRAVFNEFLRITDMAIQAGRSPAEIVYSLSKERGYAPKGAAAGASALDTIAAGQAAAKTLSAAGGRTPAASTSPEAQLANLSGAALVSAWNKIKRESFAA